MTRTSTQSSARPVTLSLGRLHRFILAYYAKKRGQSQAEIVRLLCESIVRSELARGDFDARGFRRFVDEDDGAERSERGEMKAEVDRFLLELKKTT